MTDSATFDQLVGANLRTYRNARGLSQADLASALSAGGELVHPQTIQKIEKGARPLRYAEALRICHVLKIGVAQLADGDEHARANGRYMQRYQALSHAAGDLDDFAGRLVPILVDLAHLIALERNDAEARQATAHVVEGARDWLTYPWGKHLDDAIMTQVQAHPDLTSLRADVDAPTYAVVLQHVSEIQIRDYDPDIDNGNEVDDDSEA
jgi:transcriptional regulator with XRE-family HTH domain